MASRGSVLLQLFLICSLLCLRSKAEATGSVFFIDSATHKYLRARSPGDAVESNTISLPEVGATVSVLLGLHPPATLSAASSSKLNEVLTPNPFDRPRAAFVVEVRGVQDSRPLIESDLLKDARRKVVSTLEKANIQIPDEEVSVVSIDESVSLETDSFTDEEIRNFASWMGGSYVHDGLAVVNGKLTIPLGNNAEISLSMSKKADREFTRRLISLVHNIKRAIEMHQDFSQSMARPAELIKGSFDGIKVLQEHYGSDGVAEQGERLLLAVLTKMYNSLNAAYDGQIVGAIFFNNDVTSDALLNVLNVVINSKSSARFLEEEKSFPSAADIERLLVRRTLAWLTGIILLISTLMGIYFLLYMPITRDTLLYANVKLD